MPSTPNDVMRSSRCIISYGCKTLERDLVVSKIDMLDLDGSPTSLTGPFVAFFLAFPFDSGGSTRRFGLDVEATF